MSKYASNSHHSLLVSQEFRCFPYFFPGYQEIACSTWMFWLRAVAGDDLNLLCLAQSRKAAEFFSLPLRLRGSARDFSDSILVGHLGPCHSQLTLYYPKPFIHWVSPRLLARC